MSKPIAPTGNMSHDEYRKRYAEYQKALSEWFAAQEHVGDNAIDVRSITITEVNDSEGFPDDVIYEGDGCGMEDALIQHFCGSKPYDTSVVMSEEDQRNYDACMTLSAEVDHYIDTGVRDDAFGEAERFLGCKVDFILE